MPEQKTVLVTGVSNHWGARLAAHLLAATDFHVIGLDADPPCDHIEGLDFIQADVRNTLIVDLLRAEAVDTVCHLAFRESYRRSEAAFDLNVMGTMKVLGAAAAAGVRKIVIKSSTAVYGARPDNSAFLAEERPLTNQPATGTIHDLVEIETFCNGFRGQYPHIILTVLRFANIIGPKVDTPMTRFLGTQFTPKLLGFDPRIQVIHEEDVIEALAHAVVHDVPGVFNVAAEGVLPLSKAMALAGKMAIPVFHLAAYWGNPLFAALGGPVDRTCPLGLDYLRYSCVGDLTKMRGVLDFTPRYTAVEALREFAGRKRLEPFVPSADALAYDEERLRDTIERRKRARAQVARAGALDEGSVNEEPQEEVV